MELIDQRGSVILDQKYSVIYDEAGPITVSENWIAHNSTVHAHGDIYTSDITGQLVK